MTTEEYEKASELFDELDQLTCAKANIENGGKIYVQGVFKAPSEDDSSVRTKPASIPESSRDVILKAVTDRITEVTNEIAAI